MSSTPTSFLDHPIKIDKKPVREMKLRLLLFVGFFCLVFAGMFGTPGSSVHLVLDELGHPIVDSRGMPLTEDDPWGSFMINKVSYLLLLVSAFCFIKVLIRIMLRVFRRS